MDIRALVISIVIFLSCFLLIAGVVTENAFAISILCLLSVVAIVLIIYSFVTHDENYIKWKKRLTTNKE